jgi:hypothetical protein
VTLIVMKRGGQPGSIAINPALVTYVRSASGPFTDVHFGEHHVSVEGTFDQVVARLTGDPGGAPDKPAIRSWIKTP